MIFEPSVSLSLRVLQVHIHWRRTAGGGGTTIRASLAAGEAWYESGSRHWVRVCAIRPSQFPGMLIYICICIYVYVCVYIYIYKYIYIYIYVSHLAHDL